MTILIIAPTVASLVLLAWVVDIPFMLWSVAWSGFYTGLSAVLQAVFGTEPVEGYPKWAYFSSLFQQVIVLPFLTAGLVYSHRNELNDWLYGPTDTTATDVWRIAVFSSIAGAMLKDYWVYGNLNEWFYIVHHIISIYACCFCSASPVYLGQIALNGIQAESWSLIYNIRTLWPSIPTRIAHISIMTASNFAGLWMCYDFCQLDVPGILFHKLSYAFISVGLVAVRFAGVNESVRDLIEVERMSPKKAVRVSRS
jgi:hypothetical protein